MRYPELVSILEQGCLIGQIDINKVKYKDKITEKKEIIVYKQILTVMYSLTLETLGAERNDYDRGFSGQ